MAHLTDQPGGPAPAQPVRAVPAATRRSGLPGTLRSEFTKLRSVRSTWITLAVFFVASVVIAVLSAAGDRRNSGQAQFDPARDSLAGMLYLGMLVIGATGVVAIASEYGTRMIATSLTAMPRRAVLYAAKAIALACVILVVALVILALAYVIRTALLNVLIVTAPLAALLLVLPQTRTHATSWMNLFFATVFMQAVQLIVLRVATATAFDNGGGLISTLYALATLFLMLKVPGALSTAQHLETKAHTGFHHLQKSAEKLISPHHTKAHA